MDAIELLVCQHREIEAAMRDVLEAAGETSTRKLFESVADQITLHITSEEQVFYPAVRAHRMQGVLLESLEEHPSLRRLLADLLGLDPAARTFAPKFKVLQEETEHHQKDEEEHLFPKVRNSIDEAQREALGMEMLALQRHLGRIGDPRELVVGETHSVEPR